MPSRMICGVMFTMCACRMRRRFTTSVICIRERSSFACTCTAKIDTSDDSISVRISAGISVRGRGARSSSTNPAHLHPSRSSSCAIAAPIVSVAKSVISVTFSSGLIRKQVVTAERAPGVKSAGKSIESRCVAVSIMRLVRSLPGASERDAYSVRLKEFDREGNRARRRDPAVTGPEPASPSDSIGRLARVHLREELSSLERVRYVDRRLHLDRFPIPQHRLVLPLPHRIDRRLVKIPANALLHIYVLHRPVLADDRVQHHLAFHVLNLGLLRILRWHLMNKLEHLHVDMLRLRDAAVRRRIIHAHAQGQGRCARRNSDQRAHGDHDRPPRSAHLYALFRQFHDSPLKVT